MQLVRNVFSADESTKEQWALEQSREPQATPEPNGTPRLAVRGALLGGFHEGRQYPPGEGRDVDLQQRRDEKILSRIMSIGIEIAHS